MAGFVIDTTVEHSSQSNTMYLYHRGHSVGQLEPARVLPIELGAGDVVLPFDDSGSRSICTRPSAAVNSLIRKLSPATS